MHGVAKSWRRLNENSNNKSHFTDADYEAERQEKRQTHVSLVSPLSPEFSLTWQEGHVPSEDGEDVLPVPNRPVANLQILSSSWEVLLMRLLPPPPPPPSWRPSPLRRDQSLAYTIHRIYCHLPTACREADTLPGLATGQLALGHPALFTHVSRRMGGRPHWQQLYFSFSASAPSPLLHTQSLAHFSHSSGQQEQQPADKGRDAQSDGLSSPICPHQKEGGRGGVPEVTAPHFLVLHLG